MGNDISTKATVIRKVGNVAVHEAKQIIYESPFTDTAPHGPDTIFTDDEVDGIITILDEVRAHAAPTETVA